MTYQIAETLEKYGTSGMLWVCRGSTTGRGMRLHQVPSCYGLGEDYLGSIVCSTPQEAVDEYVRMKENLSD